MKTFLLGASVLILLGTLIASLATEGRGPQYLAQSLQLFPQELKGWKADESIKLTEHVERELGASEYILRTYRRGDRSVDLFIGYYADQRAGESMHSPKNCLPGSGWEISRFGTTEIPVDSGRVAINELEIQNGATRALAFYWYQTPQRINSSEYAGKAFLIWDALAGRGTSGSIIRIIVPDIQHGEDAKALASAIIPEMNISFRRP